ncbi:hypothetical protein EYZ11_006943 [Aspergillus tanneri]|uniref:Uncharacterized protein n=1 Tax=Aspergillus tanneri TaxID=1220188 RepID=A0A4S3JEK1_9EURO|nr:uncharacterized protein ATNIH1004_011527 [Aspergillus tanneri]KAA8642582.1 hypothetical protein ATNIH1004_011527 [Aspergillus tanneri]THC93590.1 hypothetical protein EYZ11_006943 [Aspergillus tanneri]
MAPRRHATPWRERRSVQGGFLDQKKRAKADRERFRRGKWACFKRLNDLYLDGIDVGRERHIYVVVSTKAKGRDESTRYTTYNSHPNEDWVPPFDMVTNHWPQTDQWAPKDFERKQGKDLQKTQNSQAATNRQPRFTIPAPPALNLPLTPILAEFAP